MSDWRLKLINQEEKKQLTFWEFINNYKIEIPIIQRDYAQGREENKPIRLTFLDTIYDCITSNKPINLDFIYGNIVKRDNEDIFQPLDGQQRLTTMFLLHLYAYKKEGQNDNHINKTFAKFIYQTRISAREFCEELSLNPLHIDNNMDEISSTIKNSEWYYLSWKNDPTIRAMLVMLDAIHSKFKNIENLFDKLVNNKLISFYVLILDDFGLSDDLYIKMNARGKLLTPFENLKAEIQKKAKDKNWESDKEEPEKFAYKIDGSWTDLMWDNFRIGDSVDEAHMRLISTIIMLHIALSSDQDNDERREIIKKINDKYDDRCLIRYLNEKVFEYICKTYRIYEEIMESNNNLACKFKLWRHKPRCGFFDEVVYDCNSSTEKNSSYTCKILFYAQTEYLLRNPIFDKEKFQDWMRVIRNIVIKGDIDLNTKNCKRSDIVRSPKAFIGIVKLVNELANGSSDIMKFLCENEIKSGMAKDRIDEEKIKAKIITKHPEYKNLIIELEDIEILKGKILFALKCAKYDQIDIESIDWEMLKNIKLVLLKYFNSEHETLSNDLRRALLTIEVDGNYRFYDYWTSTCTILDDAPNKRRLLESFNELEYLANNDEYGKYLIKLVGLLVNKTYLEIISDFDSCPKEDFIKLPDWQIRLIIEPELLDEMDTYYIAISGNGDNNKKCYLLPNSRPRDREKCISI